MTSKCRISLYSLAAIFILALGFGLSGQCAAKKPAKRASAKKASAKKIAVKPSATAAPKVLTVVAGCPFECVPSKGASKVSIIACAEETEPATFTVRSSKPLVGVKVSPLGSFGKIPDSAIQISKVEGENLAGEAGGVITDLGPQPTQFWLDVTVPRGTPPGVYQGKIAFYVQGKPYDAVPVEVKVLPLRLVGSSKQYILYTSYGPDGRASEMDADAYQGFVNAFRGYQFKSISVNASPAGVQDVLTNYKILGLTGPIPYTAYAFGSGDIPAEDQLKAVDDAKKAAGLASMFVFAVDDPKNELQISAAIQQIEALHAVKALSAARVSDERALERLDPYLDGINYSVDMPYVQSLISGQAKKTSMKMDWYWWDARKSVTDNRLYSGVMIWKSGLYGCMPVWMPQEGAGPMDGVRSLQGEALREGVDDTRYLTTFMKALRELKDQKRQKDKDYIASTETYLTNFMSQPLQQLTPAQLCGLRAKLVEFSLALAARM